MSQGVESLVKTLLDTTNAFYKEGNKANSEEYIGLDKIKEEFLSMHLPRSAEILDVAPGPGILSAKLQLEGYGCIDALDDNIDNVRELMTKDLYQNYVCKTLTGLNTSGLNEDVYDVILMVGGFRPKGVSPKALNELFRVLRPDGHFLFTVRSDHHRHETDIGLLDENLIQLEKSKKCKILRHAEQFQDPMTKMPGLFYLIKRIDVEDFHPKGAIEEAKLPAIVVDALKSDIAQDGNAEQVYATGDLMHVRGLAEDVVMVGEYTGHVKLCQAFFKLRLPRTVEVLDVSAHEDNPGLVGLELSHNGYEQVDGLDHSLDSLNLTRAKKTYRNYILGRVAELGSIPTNDESYDVILMSKGFAPGKIQPSAFPELIRILRPGGYILWTMQDVVDPRDQEFALFDVYLADLAVERKWEVLVGPVIFENYSNGNPGRFYMLRKCHREVYAVGSPRHSPTSSPRLSQRRLSQRRLSHQLAF